MSEKRAAETAWTRLASETAPPPNAVIELAKFPIQCGEQMPWLAIGMNLDGFNLKEVFLGATHWRLAPQRRHELTVGVPADEITRLTARIAELAWQPIDTAPYSTPVEVRVGSMTFLARLESDASLSDDEQPCDQWQAVNEGEHPPCWSEGACWSSNTDEVMSRQPEAWRFARTTLEASERGTHNENLSR